MNEWCGYPRKEETLTARRRRSRLFPQYPSVPEALLALFADSPYLWLSFKEMREALKIPKRTRISWINQMVKERMLEKEVRGYNKTFYRPSLRFRKEPSRLKIIGFRSMLYENVWVIMKETEYALKHPQRSSERRVIVQTLVDDMCKSLRRWIQHY